MSKEKLRGFYLDQLKNNLIPFWENAMDETDGGVFTCFSNDGTVLASEDKYTWSQGRFLWVTEALLKMNDEGILRLDAKWERNFKQTYEFLVKHTIMENDHIVFAAKKNGEKVAEHMDTSIFADCFFVIGVSAYARYYQDQEAFELALRVFKKIRERVEAKNFRSEPYPIGKAYTSHSIPMILINVAEELQQTAEAIGDIRADVLRDYMNDYMREILQLIKGDRIVEMQHENPDVNNLLTTHLNPGHTVESVWFMIHALEKIDPSDKKLILKQLEHVTRHAIDVGWDKECGGLFRFVDQQGGKPQGELVGTPFEALIQDTWDMKLWWPHSEVLYTTLLFYELTGSDEWLFTYEKMEKYVFDTFPSDDETIGEWIQIRDRQGNPIEKVVALPVKDPFHIIRNIVLIIKLLGDKDANGRS